MKIIPNQQKSNTENKSPLGKDIALVKGSKFSAKVISVAGNNITVEIDGKSGKLKVSGVMENGHSLNRNSLTELEVLGSKDGKTLFSQLGHGKEAQTKPNFLGIAKEIPVNTTSLSDSDLKILMEVFRDKGIPLSKENVKIIADNKGFAEKIENLLKSSDIQVAGKEMPKEMKQVVLEYFKNPMASTKISEGSFQTNEMSKEVSTEQMELGKTTLVPSNSGETIKVDAEGKNPVPAKDVSSVLVQVVGETQRDKTEIKLQESRVISNDVPDEKEPLAEKKDATSKHLDFQKAIVKLMSDDVKSTLSNTNKLESLSMLLKNSMSFTLKNMVVSEKILMGEKEINSQLDDIKSMLPKDVVAAMKPLTIDQAIDQKEINNYYKELLNSLEKNIIENNLQGNPKLESRVELLRNTISFMDESEGQYNFMQIPIDLNNRQANLSVAFKKEEHGKKKVDKHNAVIFISLDTNNLAVVQSKIVVKMSDLNVNIRVSSEEIKGVILDQLDALRDNLDQLSFGQVDVSVAVNHSKNNFFQMLTEEVYTADSNFDIRV